MTTLSSKASDSVVDRGADLGCMLAFLAPYLDLCHEPRRRGRQRFEEGLHGRLCRQVDVAFTSGGGVEAGNRFGDPATSGARPRGAMASSSCPSWQQFWFWHRVSPGVMAGLAC